ncbi:MAG: hypothetical protein D6812_00355 [Deltaproteobacteria bacterium]|nr:MAG: hypothetical protein D6812_00355 [Deltaproteobacteria bacterium]
MSRLRKSSWTRMLALLLVFVVVPVILATRLVGCICISTDPTDNDGDTQPDDCQCCFSQGADPVCNGVDPCAGG